jgi:hypothetical protein
MDPNELKRRLDAAAVETWGIAVFEHDHRAGTIHGCPRLREAFGW